MVSYTRMHGELIRFEAADKLELDGILCAPIDSDTCLIHLHGMTDYYDGLSVVDSMMRAAFRNDMSFFTIDTRGSGTITVFKKLKQHMVFRTIGTAFENFKDCIFDIDGAFKMLRERGYRKFVLSGHSTGCQKITYYQSRKHRKSVKALVLLGPADDYNYQIKMLGRRKHNEFLQIARRLVRLGRGKELMPPEAEPGYFSAKRYYELYRPGGLEGNMFNYSGPMKAASRILVPVFSVFGSREDYAVISPRKMLKILSNKFKHPYSKEFLVKEADHCFCNYEVDIENAVAKWLQHLPTK